MDYATANRCRYRPGMEGGHYESWFQRANHPERPLALWLRYTLFQPPGRPDEAVGEVWAVYFDGERQRVHASKQRFPLHDCLLGNETLAIGYSTLSAATVSGSADGAEGGLSWSLSVTGGNRPLLLLPPALYETRLPAAKSLVTLPDARFTGNIDVGGRQVPVHDWRGSLNHNWGRRHTDRYAWGLVAGFDNAPDVFLECATARLRVGRMWTPPMTLVVLRIGEEEYRLNGMLRALRNRGDLKDFDWRIEARERGVRVTVQLRAPREAFAALRYDNPGRPQKICLNSKLATCELSIERTGEPPRHYRSAHGAAFEILSDEPPPGVRLLL